MEMYGGQNLFVLGYIIFNPNWRFSCSSWSHGDIFILVGCVALGIWISFCGVLGSAAGFLALVAVISFSVGVAVCSVSGSGAILSGGLMTCVTCGLSIKMFPWCGLSITWGCSLVIIKSFLFLLHNLP